MESDGRKYRKNTATTGSSGEDLEQSCIEIIIEGRLPIWILEKVYQEKEQESWSVNKLGQFLGKLLRSEKVMRNQSLNTIKSQEPAKSNQ